MRFQFALGVYLITAMLGCGHVVTNPETKIVEKIVYVCGDKSQVEDPSQCPPVQPVVDTKLIYVCPDKSEVDEAALCPPYTPPIECDLTIVPEALPVVSPNTSERPVFRAKLVPTKITEDCKPSIRYTYARFVYLFTKMGWTTDTRESPAFAMKVNGSDWGLKDVVAGGTPASSWHWRNYAAPSTPTFSVPADGILLEAWCTNCAAPNNTFYIGIPVKTRWTVFWHATPEGEDRETSVQGEVDL